MRQFALVSLSIVVFLSTAFSRKKSDVAVAKTEVAAPSESSARLPVSGQCSTKMAWGISGTRRGCVETRT